MTCTVELGPAVMESELSLLMVSAQLSRDGTMLNLTGPTMTDTTFTFEAAVNSFNKSNVGNYTCTATIRPRPSSTFLTGIGQMESLPFEIIIGKFYQILCLNLTFVLYVLFIRSPLYSTSK